MKAKSQLTVGVISLIALLAYTLVHTGGLLARYIEPGLIGYVAAFGIEASVVSLSLRIGELRKSRQSTTFFLFVLVAVVIVSAIANVAEGFETSTGDKLTINNLSHLDVVQATIGLSATGLISLIVLALSEIVGTDVSQTIKLAEREEKKRQKEMTDSLPVNNGGDIDKARQVRDDKIADRRQAVLSLLNDGLSEDDMADKLNVSVRTIQRDIQSLNGKVMTK